ncbi:MAG: cyclic nucleotide-binding domain-containing protein [Syntrophobacteraceae bacterium]
MNSLDYTKFSILRDVPGHTIDRLWKKVDRKVYSKNEHIFQQGDPAESFYFLIDGELLMQVEHSRMTVTLGTLRSGYCFGWSSLMPQQRHRHTVLCSETSTVAVVPATSIRSVIDSNDFSGTTLLRNVCRLLKDRLELRTDQLMKVIESHPHLGVA